MHFFSFNKEAIMDQMNCSIGMHILQGQKKNPIDHVNANQIQWCQIKVPYIVTE